MRIPIAYEGRALDDENDTRVIAPGGLRWGEDPIPLSVLTLNGPGRLIGMVREIRREVDGTITAEIKYPVPGLAPQIELSDLDLTKPDGLGGRLRSVVLGNQPVWHSLFITNHTEEYRA